MSDGGRERASLGVEMWKSSQKWSVQRSAVRSIAWLDVCVSIATTLIASSRKWEHATIPRMSQRFPQPQWGSLHETLPVA